MTHALCCLMLPFCVAAAPDTAARRNALQDVIDRAMPCVVKLYGAAISREHGYCVGVIVSHDGLVVTTSGLLLDAAHLRAVLSDGRTVPATVVRQDDERQLALVRLEASGLPTLAPHSTSGLRPGDSVIALGNAYKVADGNEWVSVTRGVFSMRTRLRALRRMQWFDYTGEVLLYDAITSNPGMAGGPLLDLDGHWVGLIGKVVKSEQTNTYISFALPAEVVMEFLGLADAPRAPAESASATQPAASHSPHRASRHAYTGIKLFEMGLHTSAAYVDSVAAGSPAAEAGLKTDDLILAVDGAQVRTVSEYRRMIAQYRPGQRVTLAIKRGDKVVMSDIVLGESQ